MPYRLQRDNFMAWMFAALPFPTGLSLLIWDERFTSASWRFARGIPGGYSMWGGILITFGVLMLIAMIRKTDTIRQRRDAIYLTGLISVGLWWVTLGCLFLYTALEDPLANPIGAVVWTWVGIAYWGNAFYERKRFRH